MRPADIELLATPGRPALRGELILVALSRPDLAANSSRSALRRIGPDRAGWGHRRPRHRVQRFEAVLDWWARHLPVS